MSTLHRGYQNVKIASWIPNNASYLRMRLRAACGGPVYCFAKHNLCSLIGAGGHELSFTHSMNIAIKQTSNYHNMPCGCQCHTMPAAIRGVRWNAHVEHQSQVVGERGGYTIHFASLHRATSRQAHANMKPLQHVPFHATPHRGNVSPKARRHWDTYRPTCIYTKTSRHRGTN